MAKVKGCSYAPNESIYDGVIPLGMTGTGYICRVIYGSLLDENVYFQINEDESTVAAYNGTTENHPLPKKMS